MANAMTKRTQTDIDLPEHVEVTAIETSALREMERANIDIQISTAHAYPRSLKAFIQRAKDMVTVDKETAESCIYRRPVGKDENGKMTYAEGESIRLAEIVAACYGNIRWQTLITESTPRQVKAIGMAHDLESNASGKTEVVEATIKRNGQPYDERMRIVVSKAAQSKARRDAIFQVIPKSLCRSIVAEAKLVIFGKEEPLNVRRTKVQQWLMKLAIEPKRVFKALGVKGIEEIGNEELEVLTGIRTALKDGDTTIDAAFPPIEAEVADKKTTKGVGATVKKLEQARKDMDDAAAELTPTPETEPNTEEELAAQGTEQDVPW